MDREFRNAYRQHIFESRVLMRDILSIINRQNDHIAWQERTYHENMILSQDNRNSSHFVEPTTQPTAPPVNTRPNVPHVNTRPNVPHVNMRSITQPTSDNGSTGPIASSTASSSTASSSMASSSTASSMSRATGYIGPAGITGPNIWSMLRQPFPNLITPMLRPIAQALSPVIVRPTEQTISQATETIPFADISTTHYSRCPISHEDFDNNSAVIRIIHCGHYFDPQAIRQWLSTNVRCPVCRHDIRDGTISSVNMETNNVDTNNADTNNVDENDNIINHDDAIDDDAIDDDVNMPGLIDEPIDRAQTSVSFEYSNFMNQTIPSNISDFINIIAQDMITNGGENVSINFDIVPYIFDENDSDMSGNA